MQKHTVFTTASAVLLAGRMLTTDTPFHLEKSSKEWGQHYNPHKLGKQQHWSEKWPHVPQSNIEANSCYNKSSGCNRYQCWILDIIIFNSTIPLQIDDTVKCNRHANEQQGTAEEKPTTGVEVFFNSLKEVNIIGNNNGCQNPEPRMDIKSWKRFLLFLNSCRGFRPGVALVFQWDLRVRREQVPPRDRKSVV